MLKNSLRCMYMYVGLNLVFCPVPMHHRKNAEKPRVISKSIYISSNKLNYRHAIYAMSA